MATLEEKRIFDYDIKNGSIFICVYLYCTNRETSYLRHKLPFTVPDDAYITPCIIDGVRRLQVAGTTDDLTELNARLAECETKVRAIMRDNATDIPRRKQLIRDLFYTDELKATQDAKVK